MAARARLIFVGSIDPPPTNILPMVTTPPSIASTPPAVVFQLVISISPTLLIFLLTVQETCTTLLIRKQERNTEMTLSIEEITALDQFDAWADLAIKSYGLRSDLTPKEKEKALKIGRIEFKSAGATRKR